MGATFLTLLAVFATPALPAVGDDVLAVTAPDVLTQLEGQGFDFATQLGASSGEMRAADLLAVPAYADIVGHLDSDLAALRAQGPFTYGAEPHMTRVFNAGWLRSPWARMELVALIPRIDRLDFDAQSCGEVRLVYRLAYAQPDRPGQPYSRMPFAFNVIYRVKPLAQNDGQRAGGHAACAPIAQSMRIATPMVDSAAYARWLATQFAVRDGGRFALKQIEVNMQAMRIPSESKADLGGHAEYWLRAFAPRDGDSTRLDLVLLENMPDVARLAADPALRADLVGFLRSNLAAIDQGTLQLPTRFLARTARSVSTHGQYRRANRPFSQLLKPSDLAGLDFTEARVVASADAVLARLDDLTCTGCHQSHSVAGFHVLGADRAGTHALNAVRVVGSPHFLADLERRATYVDALIDGRSPDVLRPLSFQPVAKAPVGTTCLPAATQSHFKQTWDCAEHSECKVLDHRRNGLDLGVCVRPDTLPVAGDACLAGTLADGRAPHKDRLLDRRFGCAGYACKSPDKGTPGGMCDAPCAEGDQPRNAHEICAWRGGRAFDDCAQSGDWANCLDASVQRGLRAACDEQTPCRGDYICQRLRAPDAQSSSVPTEVRGYCVPNYFLYQLRLDGHPDPGHAADETAKHAAL